MKKKLDSLPHWLLIIVMIIVIIVATTTLVVGQQLSEQDVSHIVDSTLQASPNNSNAYGLLLIVLAIAVIYFGWDNKKKGDSIIDMTNKYGEVLQNTIQGNTVALNRVSDMVSNNDEKIIAAMREITRENEKYLSQTLSSHERAMRELLKEYLNK